MNKLTSEINSALAQIVSEDHVVQNGIRDALFDAVGPIFDVEASFFPLRPSSCLKPMRDLYYDLVNYYKPGTIPKAPFENRIKLIFQFGHLTETLLKKIFAYKFGVKFEQERVQYGTLTTKEGIVIPLTGSVDWLSDFNGTTSLVLCDAKSIGDFPFKKAPKADNIAQLQLYMHSGFGRENKVDKAMLVYFNKNTSDIKVIEFSYDPVLAENLLKRLQLVFQYYQDGVVPPREYVLGVDWEENYSAYKEYNNKEFLTPIESRDRISAPHEFVNLRMHVINYEDKIVDYTDRTCVAVIEKDKIVLKDL